MHLSLQGVAELEQVAVGLHADGEADRGLSVEAEERARRIRVAALDGGDVAQPEEAAVDPKVDRGKAVLRAELAVDANGDAFRSRLDDARRHDGVLGLQRAEHGLPVDAERGHLAGRELQVDDLVLSADQVDLADIRDGEHLCPHVLDIVAQLARAQPVGSEGVDVAGDVPEMIVEQRPLEPLRELVADVVDHVAHLVPDARDVAGPGGLLEVDKDGGLAGGRHAFRVVERVELLELLLDAIGDLAGRVGDRGARPSHLHDHRLDREGRVLLAPEAEIGHHPGDDGHQHEVEDERLVPQRPFGKVDLVHGNAPS